MPSLDDFMKYDGESMTSFLEDYQRSQNEVVTPMPVEIASSLPYVNYGEENGVFGYSGNDVNYSMICDADPVYRSRPMSIITGFANGYADGYDAYK
eukprot:Seg1779.7 transcript_id=Seg1779.7/GoldUCD/mRNA.D3Y31 product="hypothetical protein" pseudo=true protein_id=Seg1779.7/GoldUCD/D3Y31